MSEEQTPKKTYRLADGGLQEVHTLPQDLREAPIELWACLCESFRSGRTPGCFRASRAVVRRILHCMDASDRGDKDAIVLDEATVLLNGKIVEGITGRVFEILKYLIVHQRASIQSLEETVWSGEDVSPQTIRNRVNELRDLIIPYRYDIERVAKGVYELRNLATGRPKS